MPNANLHAIATQQPTVFPRPHRTVAQWDVCAQEWHDDMEANANRRARSDRRVAATVDFLRAKGALMPTSQVIDVGCGFGMFTAAFASHAQRAVGTDISPRMLELAAEHATEAGVSNASFETCDFQTLDLDTAPTWDGTFDLAFASITPAVSTADDLARFTRLSRAWCFLSTYVRCETPFEDDVCRAVFGYDPEPAARGRTFGEMFQALWSWGLYPEVSYYHEPVDDWKVPTRTMAQRMAERFAPQGVGIEEGTDRIEAHLASIANAQGKVRCTSDWLYAWMLWDVRERGAR